MRRVLSTTVFEALGRDRQSKFGAHVVALMPDAAARDRLVESLNASSLYGSNILAKPVSNWLGLDDLTYSKRRPLRRSIGRAFAGLAARSRSASSAGIGSPFRARSRPR